MQIKSQVLFVPEGLLRWLFLTFAQFQVGLMYKRVQGEEESPSNKLRVWTKEEWRALLKECVPLFQLLVCLQLFPSGGEKSQEETNWWNAKQLRPPAACWLIRTRHISLPFRLLETTRETLNLLGLKSNRLLFPVNIWTRFSNWLWTYLHL